MLENLKGNFIGKGGSLKTISGLNFGSNSGPSFGGSSIDATKAKIGAVIIAVLTIGNCVYQRNTLREEEVCVVDKGFELRNTPHTDSNGNVSYTTEKINLVHTTKGTYENTSSVFVGKWGTEDLQGDLVKGQRYLVEVNGVDGPADSIYPNIIKIKEKLDACLDAESAK